MIIAVDLDNTMFKEEYPEVGEIYPKAIEVVNSWYDRGHVIIINTCREGKPLEIALHALHKAGLKWHYANANDPDRIAMYGWDSRKIGCDVQIDDRGIYEKVHGVNWDHIEEWFNIFEATWKQ